MHGFEVPWLQFALGGALFLFPGFAWTWALARPVPLGHRIPLAIVVAFTITPAVLYFLNLFLRVPLNLATMSFGSAALGVLGLAAFSVRHADRWGAEPEPRAPRADRS